MSAMGMSDLDEDCVGESENFVLEVGRWGTCDGVPTCPGEGPTRSVAHRWEYLAEFS